jgi:thiol-disulfide isomerase/thioredoxin
MMSSKIFLYIFTFTCFSFKTFGQSGEITGCWMFKQTVTISGTPVLQILPNGYEIITAGDMMTIKTYLLDENKNERVTTELLSLNKTNIQSSNTKSQRKKMISASVNVKLAVLKKITNISKIQDSSTLDVVVEESWAFSSDFQSLKINKKYTDLVDSFNSYEVACIYEKSTIDDVKAFGRKSLGIDFLPENSWDKILAIAKAQKKDIFVDCYATWCGPCKEMEKSVFTVEAVSNNVNQNYISVRLQMDTTKNDPLSIRQQMALAHLFEAKFNVKVLPTFLFFSSSGDPKHIGIGGKSSKEFLQLLDDAADSTKSYFSLLSKWDKKTIPFQEMPRLVKLFRDEYDNQPVAAEIAKYYISNYLDKLLPQDFETKTNLEFCLSNQRLLTIKNKIFIYCRDEQNKVLNILGLPKTDFPKNVVKVIVFNDIVADNIRSKGLIANNPNWHEIYAKVKHATDDSIAYESVLKGKVVWYKEKKRWRKYFKTLLVFLKIRDKNKLFLTDFAWDVFDHSSSKKLLNTALEWVELDHKKNKIPENSWITMDTKAHLLYKLGRSAEAIAIEKEIIRTLPQYENSFRPKLEKMQRGEKL